MNEASTEVASHDQPESLAGPMTGEEYVASTQIVDAQEAAGLTVAYRHFAEECLEEYDLDGWTGPDFVNPDDVSVIAKSGGTASLLENGFHRGPGRGRSDFQFAGISCSAPR
jgi:hypothetical protein